MHTNNSSNTIFERISHFKELVRQADEVVLALSCSDSRVRFPIEPVIVHDNDGNEKKIMFIPLSTIGGGNPSRSRLRRVFDDIISWQVDAKKIKILVTQHGDTEEIQQRKGHYTFSHEPRQLVSCGLRKFFASYAEELTYIHSTINAWADRSKQLTDNKGLIPDGVSLEQLATECPEATTMIKDVAIKAGTKKYPFPQRLILRAAYRNATFDIEENGATVRSRVAEYLRENEFSDVFTTCSVGLADYDHNKKILYFMHSYTDLGWQEKEVKLTSLQERTVPYQDPHAVVLTFSRTLLPVPDEVLLPSPNGIADDSFKIGVSTPTIEIFLCALAEASYAILHHLTGHDLNFKSLTGINIFCDAPEHLSVIEKSLQHSEYHADFKQMISDFAPSGMNIHHLSASAVETKKLL